MRAAIAQGEGMDYAERMPVPRYEDPRDLSWLARIWRRWYLRKRLVWAEQDVQAHLDLSREYVHRARLERRLAATARAACQGWRAEIALIERDAA